MHVLFGVTSSAGRLERVAVRAPGAILTADHERWHYAHPINAVELEAQHRRFVELLSELGVDVEWMPTADDDLADSVFTYDPSFMVGSGAVLMRPGKELRQGEVELHRRFYDSAGIPVVGEIEPPGFVEGGDCFFLDSSTLAVGRGFRTNQAGIDQLTDIVATDGIEVVAYDLPYHHGPEACLHLLSLISPLADDLALVHAPLLPTALYDDLLNTGYTLLHAPPAEFDASLGLNLNVLPVAPRVCIALDGFPGTADVMRSAGCELHLFEGDELCMTCEGGPTCLTRPLLRS